MDIRPKLVEIFFFTDEFCKEFSKTLEGVQLTTDNSKKTRNKPCKFTDSEVITILIAFHLGGYRNLKDYYLNYVQKVLKSEFLSWRGFVNRANLFFNKALITDQR